MKNRFRGIISFSVLVALLLTACAGQQPGAKPQAKGQDGAWKSPIPVSLPDEIKSRGVIRIAVKSDFPPFGMVDAGGNKVGFEIDMARQMAEWAFGDPNKVELESVTSANRIPLLQSGKVDMVLATMGVTEERAKVVDFSNRYITSGVMLLVPKDSTIKDIQNLKGKKVITMKGTTGSTGLEKLVPEAEQIKLDKTSEALKALSDGRGVAFAQDDVLLFQLVKENPQFKVVGQAFNKTQWAIAVRKGDQGLLAWTNAALEEMKKRDLFKKYFDKWLRVDGMPFDPAELILRPQG